MAARRAITTGGNIYENIACLFVNPPDIIKNKKYLESVGSKDWKAVNAWWQGFYGENDQHNPNFQAFNFILQPQSKKVASIEGALQEHPTHPELLFLQSISLRDRSKSIEKLKLAVENKPEFPAALYLLGIFSLQMHQVEAAEDYIYKSDRTSTRFPGSSLPAWLFIFLVHPQFKRTGDSTFPKGGRA